MAPFRQAARAPVVIAHRGACGYLPEHTLAAKAFAYACGADYLEQDVVATRDDRLVVLHDVHVDGVTDVAERFPARHRADGRWYARDFTLEELQSLAVTERLNEARSAAYYPDRFPARSGRFSIPSIEDELALVAGLNRSTGRRVGIYPEIKRPAWHRAEGVECGDLLLDALERFGYRDADDPVYLQCFDFDELRRLREQLGCRLPMVQLIGENAWRESPTDFDWARSPTGLDAIAGIANGIGPSANQLYTDTAGESGARVPTSLVSDAHERGLVVHPYTFRADDLPAGFESLETMIRWFVGVARIDGLFTDFPDRALRIIDDLDT